MRAGRVSDKSGKRPPEIDTVDSPEISSEPVVRKSFPESWIFESITMNEGYKKFLNVINFKARECLTFALFVAFLFCLPERPPYLF